MRPNQTIGLESLATMTFTKLLSLGWRTHFLLPLWFTLYIFFFRLKILFIETFHYIYLHFGTDYSGIDNAISSRQTHPSTACTFLYHSCTAAPIVMKCVENESVDSACIRRLIFMRDCGVYKKYRTTRSVREDTQNDRENGISLREWRWTQESEHKPMRNDTF